MAKGKKKGGKAPKALPESSAVVEDDVKKEAAPTEEDRAKSRSEVTGEGSSEAAGTGREEQKAGEVATAGQGVLAESAEQVKPAGQGEPTEQGEQSEAESMQALRQELEALRLQLRGTESAEGELRRLREERDQFETQYNTLLSRLSSMKSLFSKMKESQLELENTQEQLSEYERQNATLKTRLEQLSREKKESEETVVVLNTEMASLNAECETLSVECSAYKAKLSQAQERIEKEAAAYQRERQDHAKLQRNLQSRIEELTLMMDNKKHDHASLEEQTKAYQQQLEQLQQEKAQQEQRGAELNTQLESLVSENERALRAKDQELQSLRGALEQAQDVSRTHEAKVAELRSQIDAMSADAALKDKLEQECKERVLQIGKLRHEAVILNEHLTKALAMIKHSNSSESVDKELISNLFISFVSIPRGDPKKFEVLELISSFLSWDDEKKTQAGLMHSSSDTIRKTRRNDSFVSLWAEFLERESEK
ncbi:ACR101Cp [Eremothecium gossypii ATCC 10895]|uniref:ACR101Cp n=1 Tax=Eremothecium gossypii (strain ATCC 10895 / CBS 109.51 / FGSC 9923 / NRRL Y-1056) TaxID=284811 RepID=Q75C16_EREGS|nr:ACR101Cp [Eremothecium gossypii ATCC 10895]AAS51327.2 ACR101Cp [Eremothecium gossypii ATCC 10895]